MGLRDIIFEYRPCGGLLMMFPPHGSARGYCWGGVLLIRIQPVNGLDTVHDCGRGRCGLFRRRYFGSSLLTLGLFVPKLLYFELSPP